MENMSQKTTSPDSEELFSGISLKRTVTEMKFKVTIECSCCRGARAECEDGCGKLDERFDISGVALRLEIRDQRCEPSKSKAAFKRVFLETAVSFVKDKRED